MITNRPCLPFSGSPLLRVLSVLPRALLAFAPVALHAAETPSLPPGRYVLDRNSLRGFEEALNGAVKELPPIPAQRRIALRRLRELLNPPAEIVLASSEAGWAVQLGEHQFPAIQPGAEPVAWTGKDARKAEVSLRWRGEALEQSITSGERARMNTFTYDPEAEVLLLEVKVQGAQLELPVHFTVRYPSAH